MTRKYLAWFLAILLTGLLLLSCSNSGGIIAPGSSGDEEPLKEVTAPGDSYTRYIWDIGEVIINRQTKTVEIIPARSLEVNVNVIKFMQPPGFPSSVGYTLNIGQSNFATGYIDLDMKLTHPFPQNLYWGHDVRLIIMGMGSEAGQYDTSVRYPQPDQLRMENADGYTRWWNMVEFFGGGNSIFEYKDGELGLGTSTSTSRVNPYKYFADSVSKGEYPPDIDIPTRGEFRSGNMNERHMILQFPTLGPSIDWRFKYAVDASWEEPINTPVDSSDDFSLDANCREAYQIKVDQTGSTVYFANAGDLGGNLNLNIEIFDWKQGGGTVEDEIARVVVESPTLFDNQGGFIDITSLANVSPGTNSNSVVYSYTIPNCTPDSQFDQEVLITVEDAITTSYAPPFGAFPYPNKPLAAYQLYTAIVGDGGPTEKTLTVVVPNGGETWQIGAAETVFWTSTGPISDVKVDYSTDGGSTFPYTIVGSTPNDGNFAWDPISDTPSDQAIVRVSEVGNPTVADVSDAVFSIIEEPKIITVVLPNGGESLEIGGTFEITWTSSGVIDNVKIKYSTDSGSTYPNEITASTPNDGAFSWDPIPDDPTTTARIKISDATDDLVFDESDADFEITATPSNLTVLVPNGGETWQIGSAHAITWTSEGPITNVKIEYYKDDDYGGTVVEIIASTPDDGLFDWDPIPDDPTTTARVRVSDVDSPGIFDDSDEHFTISTEAAVGWEKTLSGVEIIPQPDQGANMPDICVTNLGDPDFSRGQVMVGELDDLTVNMYSNDYSSIVATYDLWLGDMYDLDLSDYNRMDFPMIYADIIGLSCSSDTSPFPMNPFNDPGHASTLCAANSDGAVGFYGWWVHGDLDPEGDVPPDSDPDEDPWTHITDFDSGVLGGPNSDPDIDDTFIWWIMTYSEHPDQPHINASSTVWFNSTYDDPDDADNFYNQVMESWWALGGLSTQGLDPGYVDDTDPDSMRLAISDDSGLTAGDESADITTWYIMDTADRVHIFHTYEDSLGGHYIGYDDGYMGSGGTLGIDFGGTPVDIVCMPSRLYEYDDWTWLCVLVDDGSGGWHIKVYQMDYIGPDPDNPELVITELAQTATQTGTPSAFDADNFEYELHVLYDDGGTYKVTVWGYSE